MNAVTLIASLLWLVTGACGVAAVIALMRALGFQSRGVRLDGRIVGHAEESEGSSVSALVEYVVGGVPYRVQTTMTAARDQLPIGMTKTVLYMPDDPSKGRVVSGRDLFVSTMALSIAAVVVGAVAAGLTYLGAFG